MNGPLEDYLGQNMGRIEGSRCRTNFLSHVLRDEDKFVGNLKSQDR
jgi:hypothetical protein